MSDDMLDRAYLNATKASIKNVKFVKSAITSTSLEAESADCIISNCVINLLSPDDKKICFGEIFRLLKPGGRLAISDTLAKKKFPEDLQRDMGLYVGCISGANLVSEYEAWLKDVGFEGKIMCTFKPLQHEAVTDTPGTDIMIVDKKIDLNIYKERNGKAPAASCCVPSAKIDMEAEAITCCAPSSSCCSTEPKKIGRAHV